MSETRILLRSWRIMEAEPYGLMMWFDPLRERPELYTLEPGQDSGVDEFREGNEPDESGFPNSSETEPESGLPF